MSRIQKSRAKTFGWVIVMSAGALALTLTACNKDESSGAPATEGQASDYDQAGQGSTTGQAPSGAGQAPAGETGQPPPGAGSRTGETGAPPEAAGAHPREAEQMGSPHGGASPGEASDISDDDLESFVEAYMEAQDVQTGLEGDLRSAEDQREAQQIQQEAMSQIREKVEKTGMSFEKYGTIAEQIQRDPQLQQRFTATLQTMQE